MDISLRIVQYFISFSFSFSFTSISILFIPIQSPSRFRYFSFTFSIQIINHHLDFDTFHSHFRFRVFNCITGKLCEHNCVNRSYWIYYILYFHIISRNPNEDLKQNYFVRESNIPCFQLSSQLYKQQYIKGWYLVGKCFMTTVIIISDMQVKSFECGKSLVKSILNSQL